MPDLASENAAAAARSARMLELHRRRAAERDQAPIRFFTPAQETVVEIGELWSVSPGRIRSELQRGRVLAAFFPGIWALCLAGRLDLYRAGLVADAAVGTLPESQWGLLAERMTAWLRGRLRRRGTDPDLLELVGCTPEQLRNKLTYATTRLRPRDADERFKKAHAARRATARPVIDVTVPIQTLRGVSDDPGTLSGGVVLPATPARMIASTPGSTWHRMLTDPAGRCLEVSTTSYRPTAPIWNERHAPGFGVSTSEQGRGAADPLGVPAPGARGSEALRDLRGHRGPLP